MPFQIVRNDITKVEAEAIVNTANPHPVIGGGTDSAVYEAAGKELLLAARRQIGEIEPGCCAATSAFALHAKYIIHTVGPVWIDGNHAERELLRKCYSASLALAQELGCSSIAFPLIASGAYAFPKEDALSIALEEIGKYLLSHEMQVCLVVFDRDSFVLSNAIFPGLAGRMDEAGVARRLEEEYAIDVHDRMQQYARRENVYARRRERYDASAAGPAARKKADSGSEEESLDHYLRVREASFQKQLFHLIDQKQLDDVAVYKKANIDRKAFSKIRCNENYRPKKQTVFALAIALELDMQSTADLLARAGFSFSPSSTFDRIVSYFIAHRNYNIYDINAALFKYDQPMLGE